MVVALYISSIVSGYGQAVVWVVQGEYISLCSNEDNKGFYFGFFWVLYESSQIFGNLTGALIIENTTGPMFFFIMFCIMVLAVIGFTFIKIPTQVEPEEIKRVSYHISEKVDRELSLGETKISK